MSGEVGFVAVVPVAVVVVGVVGAAVVAYGTAIAVAEVAKGTVRVAQVASETAAVAVDAAMEKMRSEYLGAQADLALHAREQLEQSAAVAATAREASGEAARHAESTKVTATSDATVEMVKAQAQALLARTHDLPGAPADLEQRCRQIIAAAASGAPGDELARDLADIARALAAASARSARGGATPQQLAVVHALAAGARQMLGAEDLLIGIDPALRARLEEDLQACETLAPRQAAVALQGIEVVQARLHDELAACRGRARELERGAALIAAQGDDVEAQLRAVQATARVDTFRIRARDLLAKLTAARRDGIELRAAEALVSDTAQVFGLCAADIARAAIDDYAGDTVRDVLGELGYSLGEVEGGEVARPGTVDRFVAPIGEGLAVEFTVSEGAAVNTELVSTSADAHADAAAEKKACDLADAVTAGLRRRKIEVRPGSRRSIHASRALRTVGVAARRKSSQRQEPKKMEADGR